MNSPLRYRDPTGECPWCIVIIGGAAFGAGSEFLFQTGSNLWNGRDVFDPDCYDWGEIGIAGGLGAFGGGIGRVAGGALRYGAKSLTRETGLEWSHSIGRAWVNRNASGALNKLLNMRGGLNGRWVTPKQHYMHDPFRWPKGWPRWGGRYQHAWQRGIDRIPAWLRGIGIGTGAGVGLGEVDGE
jgi:hypothetical protein